MNRITALIPVLALSLSSQAVAMSEPCESLAERVLSVSPSDQVLISAVVGATYIGIGLAVATRIQAGAGIRGHGIGMLRASASAVGAVGTGLATSSLGTLSALVRATASSDAPVSSTDQRDFMRQYRGTQDYRCVTDELGRARTEEFFANAFSGWTIDELARRYLSGEEYDRFLVMSAIDSNCSEDTMTCGG